jgi:hypothetical protein
MTGTKSDEKADISELIQSDRVRAISEARETVIETMNLSEALYHENELSKDDKQLQIARATESYIRELGFLLRDSEVGEEYWENIELGTWSIEPPEPNILIWRYIERTGEGITPTDTYPEMPTNYELENTEDFEVRQIEFQGLKSFVKTPIRKEIEYTARFRRRFHSQTKNITESVTRIVPEQISKRAFSLTNDFAGKMGLDVEVTEGLPDDELQL